MLGPCVQQEARRCGGGRHLSSSVSDISTAGLDQAGVCQCGVPPVGHTQTQPTAGSQPADEYRVEESEQHRDGDPNRPVVGSVIRRIFRMPCSSKCHSRVVFAAFPLNFQNDVAGRCGPSWLDGAQSNGGTIPGGHSIGTAARATNPPGGQGRDWSSILLLSVVIAATESWRVSG